MLAYNPTIDRSDCQSIHPEVIDLVRQTLPEENVILDLADTFKLFSDPTRVKILYALSQNELCVCDISVLLGMTKSAISHQLRILRQANLIKYRKGEDGRVTYYSIADEHVELILARGMEHVLEKY